MSKVGEPGYVSGNSLYPTSVGTAPVKPLGHNQTSDGLVGYKTNPLTGGIEIRNLQNDGNNIAFIGDSRMRYGLRNWFKNITPSGGAGVFADWLGVGPAVTVDSVGTLEFRAADKSFRWTAPSDTAGAWTPATVGKMIIDSASADKQIYFVLRSMSLPSTDQTYSMTCTGTMHAKVEWLSSVPDVMSRYRYGPDAYYLGAGGATTAECVEMLPWYKLQASGAGIDVIRVGTNDISNGTISVGTMIANATALFNARIGEGRKLVICGEPARWGVNTSTPITAQQLSCLIAYNKALSLYAEARASVCRYVDLYAISRDPAYIDGRPFNGILLDTVHDGIAGSIAFGSAIKSAIDSLGGCSIAGFQMAGDSSIVFNNSSTWMHGGTAGVLNTGATGQAPTGITVGRVSGSDLTLVSSIVSYPDHQGKRTQLDITSTTANNIAECSSNLPSTTPTIETMGLVAGDFIEFEADIEVVSGSPTSIEIFISLLGSLRRTAVYVPGVVGSYHVKSAPIKLLAEDTTIRQMAYITMPASATASVRIGEFITRKV